MSLNREQAQALAHLTHLLRPAWAPEGIYAALGRCQDRDAFLVALATLRAAADPKAKTPGVIPSTGSHWNEYPPVELSPPRRMPPTRDEACAVCGKRAGEHNRWSEHDFVTAAHASRGRVPPPGDLVRDAIREASPNHRDTTTEGASA